MTRYLMFKISPLLLQHPWTELLASMTPFDQIIGSMFFLYGHTCAVTHLQIAGRDLHFRDVCRTIYSKKKQREHIDFHHTFVCLSWQLFLDLFLWRHYINHFLFLPSDSLSGVWQMHAKQQHWLQIKHSIPCSTDTVQWRIWDVEHTSNLTNPK